MANLTYLVRSTWTASDASLANGVISLPGVYDANSGTTKTVTLDYNGVKKVKFGEGAAATQGVVTAVVSGTLTAGNIFSFQLVQDISSLNNNLPDTYSSLISYTIKSGDTATTVGDAIALMINNLPFEATAANSSGTVTITATAANPSIIGAEVSDQGANLAITNTTAGVKGIGVGADLIALGIAEAVSGQSYDVYNVTFKTFKYTSADDVSERSDLITLFIDETAGTTSGAYGTALSTILNGSSTTANYLDVMS
jgi:hypothetical protein